MATRIADTLGQMGEGDYPLVHAKDVDLTDGQDLQTFIDNLDLSGDAEDVAYENATYGEETNVKEWLDKILDKIYYVAIKINSLSSAPEGTTYEMGRQINSVTLSWNLNKTPTSQSINGIGTIANDVRTITIDEPFVNVNKTFTLTVSDGETTVSSSKSFKFAPNIYWGSASLEEEYDSEWVQDLSTKALKSSASGTYEMTVANDEYGFFVLPSSYSFSGVVKIGGFDTELALVDEVSVTNQYEYTQNYKIYRTGQKSLGKITMIV